LSKANHEPHEKHERAAHLLFVLFVWFVVKSCGFAATPPRLDASAPTSDPEGRGVTHTWTRVS